MTVILSAGLLAPAAGAVRASLHISPTNVQAGEVVKITGRAQGGCLVGDTVYVLSRAFSPRHEFAGVPAVLMRLRRGGTFGTTTRIPRDRRAGRYAVTARCGGGNLGITLHLRVRR